MNDADINMKSPEVWAEEIEWERDYVETKDHKTIQDWIREIQSNATIAFENKLARHEVALSRILSTIEHLRNPELGDDTEYRDAMFDELTETINSVRPK